MKITTYLTFATIFLSTFLFSQKKYPSLLWEISGNGLQEKSYLYGTFHVSEKVAFNLSDLFFEKLYSVKQIALESDPELWLEAIKNYEKNLPLYPYYLYSDNDYYTNYTYTSLYSSPVERKNYKKALNLNDQITDVILHRTYESRQNFQEDTYLDMFIYRAAKKLNKKFYGLEDILESEKLMEKARENEYGYYENRKPWLKKLLKGRTEQAAIEDAYREQDLDLIDSISKGFSSTKNLEYSLYIRNENMVTAMDSLMKKGSLFAAVGAAHLAGKKGIIEKLRDKGYTVTPLKGPYTEKGKKQKEHIDQLLHSRALSDQSQFENFTIKAPVSFIDFNEKQLTYYISLDIPNGAYLSLSKFNHFDFLSTSSFPISLSSIDSLLYENIPGKILSKKRITNNGYPGIEVVTKNDKNEYLNTQILLTPLETYIFSLKGSKNYENQYKTPIFSSLKLKSFAGTFSDFSPKYGGYKVSLPDYRINPDSLHVTAYDKTSNSYYFINTQVFDEISPEEEEYELNRIPYEFGKNIKSKNINTRIVKASIPYSESVIQLTDNKNLYLKTIINGAHYHIAGIVTSYDQLKQSFFNSFQLSDFISNGEYEQHTHISKEYSVSIPKINKETQKFNITDSVETDDFYYPENSSEFKLENKQKITITSYDDLYYLENDSIQPREIIKEFVQSTYPSDSCANSLKTEFIKNGISTHKYPYYEYTAANKNSAQLYKLRYYYQNNKIYELKYINNKHQEFKNPSINKVLNDITFYLKPEESITDSIDVPDFNLEDLMSAKEWYEENKYKIETDSTLWVSANKKNQPVLDKLKTISTDYKKVENFMLSGPQDIYNSEILNTAISILDSHDKTKSSFYESLYPKFTKYGNLQFSILNKIIKLDSIRGIKKSLQLIKKDIPIPGSESTIYDMIYNSGYYIDNPEDYFLPELLNYLPVKEYYTSIFSFLDNTYSNDKLKIKHIKKHRKYFFTDAETTLKRIISKSEQSEYDYYDNDNSDNLLHLNSVLNILSIFNDQEYFSLLSEIKNTRNPELIKLLSELKNPVELTEQEYNILIKEDIPSAEIAEAYKNNFGKNLFDPKKDLTIDLVKNILSKKINQGNYYYSDLNTDSLTFKGEKNLDFDKKNNKIFYFTTTKNKKQESIYEPETEDPDNSIEEAKEDDKETYLIIIAFDVTPEKDNDNECENNYIIDYYDDSQSVVPVIYYSDTPVYYEENEWNEMEEALIDYLKNKDHTRATTYYKQYSNEYDYY